MVTNLSCCGWSASTWFLLYAWKFTVSPRQRCNTTGIRVPFYIIDSNSIGYRGLEAFTVKAIVVPICCSLSKLKSPQQRIICILHFILSQKNCNAWCPYFLILSIWITSSSRQYNYPEMVLLSILCKSLSFVFMLCATPEHILQAQHDTSESKAPQRQDSL